MSREAARLRGHSFLPEKKALDAIPRIYETERTPAPDKVIHVKYFVASATWFVCELSEDRRTAFGFADLGDPQNAEWGYIDMDALQELLVSPWGFPMVVERDLAWEPVPFSEVRR